MEAAMARAKGRFDVPLKIFTGRYSIDSIEKQKPTHKGGLNPRNAGEI
jgi:hypothetical protein